MGNFQTLPQASGALRSAAWGYSCAAAPRLFDIHRQISYYCQSREGKLHSAEGS